MTFEVGYETLIAALGTLFAIYKAICLVLDRYHVGEKRKEYQVMRAANKNLMRELIRTAHRDCVEDGWIDEDELEHIEQVYDTYSKLGGNGTAKRWIEELRALPREKEL